MKLQKRLLYLDWVRGFAAIVMLQGHVFDSFTRADLRPGGAFLFSQLLGGMPPAIFLFLTGITFAFLMDGQERRGMPAGTRILASLRRSGYLFLIALLFRVQLWAFSSPRNPWTDIFRVDVLNCMGFAIAVMSAMAIFKTLERIRLCAILGIAIALAAPLVSQVNWSSAPWLLRDYLVPNKLFFGFFPWAAFVAFGMSAGSLLRTLREEQIPQAMQWIALAGIVLTFGANALSSVTYSVYAKSDFWLDNPCLIFIKLGVVLLILPFAYVWTRQPSAQGWSWVRQFGVTSLLVYWVHIELVYGRWLGALKELLTVEQTIFAAVCLILLMLGLSLLRTNFPNWRGWLA
ncbi:MAG: heparan-alpha-glucosaminide N-acetyltransferase domain-containing protein, partial [Acidobacteriota bacterium]|nr:heparan-alpha-glucosaminide N-acetyltransferase domain-containing protein [Acidobacteriota bacterium]